MRFGLILSGTVVFLGALADAQDGRRRGRESGPKVGKPAPAFTLKTIDGKDEISLKDLRGKPVALVFGSYT